MLQLPRGTCYVCYVPAIEGKSFCPAAKKVINIYSKIYINLYMRYLINSFLFYIIKNHSKKFKDLKM